MTVVALCILAFVGQSVPSVPRVDPAEVMPSRSIAPNDFVPAVPGLWDPSFRKFGPWDYAASLVLASSLLGIEEIDVHERLVKIEGRNAIDGPVTDFFSLESVDARTRAAELSDKILFWSQIYPYALDGIVVPLLARQDPELAWEMTMMNVQAFALSTLLVRLGHRFVARERPAMEHCDTDPGYYYGCENREAFGNYSSFLSGHVSVVMTGAGLTCAHHMHIPLYGGGIWDKLPCYGMLAIGTFQSALRLMADKHYFSDVVLGSAIGLVAGYGVPTWLHYKWNPLSQTELHLTLLPQVTGTTTGLQVMGWY